MTRHVITKDSIIIVLLLLPIFLIGGCGSMYYGAMEKMGYEKRDILVDRVEDARESQQEAKQQFESALEQFIAVTNYSGGDLEKQYKTLKREYDDSESRAEEVHDKIVSIEKVAADLFEEWNDELKQYTNKELRKSSEKQLAATQKSYKTLISTMKTAESKISPVLSAFKDRVLYLKHNLNANAIDSLRTQKKIVQSDIAALIEDMNKSIAEADRFIKSMSN